MTGSPTAPNTADPSAALTRGELALVVIVVLAGFGLRAALPARMAVEHFDEGVYASNYFFSGEKEDENYPIQHLYAPPLVPLLIELTMVLCGPSNIAAMGVGIVAGSLTILLVWWMGRRWFGPTAGLVAATLVALSDVHILFSRTALTDVLLCFFVLAAVHCFWIAQTTPNRLALVASGAFTGLAWWTKYSGWLPLAIGLAGVVPWRIVNLSAATSSGLVPQKSRGSRIKSLLGSLAIWGGVAIIAAAVWGPYLWSLQSKGGYAAVKANHGGYIVGFAGWSASFSAQARKLSLLSGPMTGCSGLVALVLSLCRLRAADSRFTWNALLRNDAVFFAVPVLGLLCVVEGGAVILASLGIVGAIIALTRILVAVDCSTGPTRGGLAAWMLAAWLAGLLVSVPLYTPFPRLTLPLLLATWMGVGVLADAVVREIQPSSGGAGRDFGFQLLLSRQSQGTRALARFRPIFLLILGLGIVMAIGQKSPWARGIVGWQRRDGLAVQALAIREDVARTAEGERQAGLDEFVIYTYGEPALFFQLRRLGCVYVEPVKDLEFAYPDARAPRLASYIAFGPQAWRTRGFGEQLANALPRLQLVGKYRYNPSDVVILDGPVIHHDRRPEYEIEVYLVK